MLATRLARCTAVATALALGAGVLAQATDDDGLAQARSQNEEQLDQLERQMNIGPRTALSLGWQTNWRYRMPVRATALFLASEAVFVLNERNELSMVDGSKGTLRWRTHAANATDQILDVVHLPDLKRVLILRSESILTVSDRTGMPETTGVSAGSVQKLEWLATDGGFIFGNTYVYGGLGGEVVWQGVNYGFAARAHRIGRRIDTTPVRCGNTVVAAARSGELAGLDLNTGGLSWKVTLLDRVAGRPAAADDLVVVAGRDQHLRALDPRTGRPNWTALLESPLQSGPTLLDSSVFQQIPGRGLACFEARPSHTPEGKQTWLAEDVTGDVISRSGPLLLTWDSQRRVMQAVSASTGSIETTKPLPHARIIQADDKQLVVVGVNGVLESLVPRREQ